MKDLLAPANREVLEQFAWSKALLAFDYDGTLAPIVSDPERAIMRDSTRELLVQLTRRYACVVISGRAQSDVGRLLDGVPVHGVVGNHGMEPWAATDEIAALVARWVSLLKSRLDGFRGIQIEDKVFSLAVHYRLSREKKRARLGIMKAVAELGPVRIVPGKQVINILPQGAPHKGIALERERARLLCDTAIYVGDDETDEDVFSLDQPGQLLSVRVGRRKASAAAYYIRSQRDIEALLGLLLRIRPLGDGPQNFSGERARVAP